MLWAPDEQLRRNTYLHQHRQMVGNASGVAGAGVSAEGFLAGMGRIAGEQERDAEDAHDGRR